MKKKETREYLNRVYRKTVTSFLANVYKASITGSSRDIHRTRLDVKKIFALISFFEMLSIPDLDTAEWRRFFRPIYRQAGKIREIQVNNLMLSAIEIPDQPFTAFTGWMNEQEHLAAGRFIRKVKELKEEQLEKINRMVGALCEGKAISKVRLKTGEYLLRQADKVDRLIAGEPDNRAIHDIRKHLKAMATVATLVYTIRPGKQIDTIITGLNKTEMMIGDWHDHVVLKEWISEFLSFNLSVKEDERAALEKLGTELSVQCVELTGHFMPEIKASLETVRISSEKLE